MSRGIFLDFDGTLADSIPQLRAAYAAFLARYGIEGSLAEFEELNGPSLSEIVLRLRDRYGLDPSHADLVRVYQSILHEQEPHLGMSDGAAALLDEASARGFRTAIVTSSSCTRVERFLRRNGLELAIDLIVGSEMCADSKPHPQPYLIALERLSTDPQESIAVEDSPAGVTSASAAGLRVILVGPDKMPSSAPLLTSVRSLIEVVPFLDIGP